MGQQQRQRPSESGLALQARKENEKKKEKRRSDQDKCLEERNTPAAAAAAAAAAGELLLQSLACPTFAGVNALCSNSDKQGAYFHSSATVDAPSPSLLLLLFCC